MTHSNQEEDRPAPGTSVGVALPFLTARMIASIVGTISAALMMLSIVVVIGEVPGPEELDNILRSVALFGGMAALFIAVFARSREDLQGIRDRQELLLDAIAKVAADSEIRHQMFTRDVLTRQQEDVDRTSAAQADFRRAVEDSRKRIAKLLTAVTNSEASSKDFSARAAQLDDQMQAFIAILNSVRRELEDNPPPGKVTPFRRQGT